MIYFLYLAKPIYGGWVTFASQVAKINQTHIYKITKCGEKKTRPFGYGVGYQNISLDTIRHLGETDYLFILAIDKHFHHVMNEIDLKKTSIVIHDPTEIKSQKQFLLPFLRECLKVYTIRQTVSDYLNQLAISNQFLPHPYIEIDSAISQNKMGVVSISRIDWDKHTNILLEANTLLKSPIDIYGDKNDRYVYQKLRLLDTMKEDDPTSCYKGRFPKSQEALMEILKDKQFVIDLSRIQYDGGGSQYTFIEAICNGCVLILNKNWVSSPHSIWKDGENCLAVSNPQELADVLKTIDPSQVYLLLKNAKKTTAIHTHPQTLALWNFNF